MRKTKLFFPFDSFVCRLFYQCPFNCLCHINRASLISQNGYWMIIMIHWKTPKNLYLFVYKQSFTIVKPYEITQKFLLFVILIKIDKRKEKMNMNKLLLFFFFFSWMSGCRFVIQFRFCVCVCCFGWRCFCFGVIICN